MSNHPHRKLIRRQVEDRLTAFKTYCETYWDLIPAERCVAGRNFTTWTQLNFSRECFYDAFYALKEIERGGLSFIKLWKANEPWFRRHIREQVEQERHEIYREMREYYSK